LSEWEAYDRIDPIGDWRADFNFATLKSLLMNMNLSIYRKRGTIPKFTAPIDFMPDWSGELRKVAVKKQSVEEMKQLLLGMARVQNEKVAKERRLNDSKRLPASIRRKKEENK